MKKTTPAIIATILITSFLIGAMFMIGQNALSALTSAAALLVL